jgi:hypothetical protein
MRVAAPELIFSIRKISQDGKVGFGVLISSTPTFSVYPSVGKEINTVQDSRLIVWAFGIILKFYRSIKCN